VRHWATINRVVIAGRRPSQVTRRYIAHLRLAVRDIGYEQAGSHWEKASIEVHLHRRPSPRIQD
jgi:S-adenosylmethionine synthetase